MDRNKILIMEANLYLLEKKIEDRISQHSKGERITFSERRNIELRVVSYLNAYQAVLTARLDLIPINDVVGTWVSEADPDLN